MRAACSLRDFRNRQSIYDTERANAISRGERVLHEGGVQAARMERADISASETFVTECKQETARLRGEADQCTWGHGHDNCSFLSRATCV